MEAKKFILSFYVYLVTIFRSIIGSLFNFLILAGFIICLAVFFAGYIIILIKKFFMFLLPFPARSYIE